jgi:WhiB family redox-sensing transcriptional regulator
MLESNPDWRTKANCAGTDPESFFVETGEYPPFLSLICKVCDVKNECLEFAIQTGAQGYWGNTNERQRNLIARRRRAILR